jgi:hypothetical protein
MDNLSDLANSCEYLTIDKLCSAVSESEKAKANRNIRCQNEEKASCCYICEIRRDCLIKCKFLGNTENDFRPTENEKATDEVTRTETKTQTSTSKETPFFCSSCSGEMSQAKTQFKVNNWKGLNPQLASEGLDKSEMLSAIVYLCPQCGKIEFKADGSRSG